MNTVIFTGFCGNSEALCSIMTIPSTVWYLFIAEGMYCKSRWGIVICALLIVDKHSTFHKSCLEQTISVRNFLCTVSLICLFYEVCLFNLLLLLHAMCVVQIILRFWCFVLQHGCVLIC
jgi:hypothetical protein